MRYSNQPQLDGVNAQEGRGEGREFLLLIIAFVVGAAILSLLFVRVGAVLGPLIPFSWERYLAPEAMLTALDTGDRQTALKLNTLAKRVATALDMPPEMAITVHYVKDDTTNAFATFGGHIVVFSGLLKRLDSEDAVAALLAHELAHVERRHIIKGATGNVLVGLMWSALGFSDASATLGQASSIPVLSMTRAMEREADAQALAALVKLYGHAGGYFALFEALGSLDFGGESVPDILRSHPKIADRIAAAEDTLGQRPRRGVLTPWR